MAAVTPPLLSDSDDDYQTIDNGPVDVPLLNNAMEYNDDDDDLFGDDYFCASPIGDKEEDADEQSDAEDNYPNTTESDEGGPEDAEVEKEKNKKTGSNRGTERQVRLSEEEKLRVAQLTAEIEKLQSSNGPGDLERAVELSGQRAQIFFAVLSRQHNISVPTPSQTRVRAARKQSNPQRLQLDHPLQLQQHSQQKGEIAEDEHNDEIENEANMSGSLPNGNDESESVAHPVAEAKDDPAEGGLDDAEVEKKMMDMKFAALKKEKEKLEDKLCYYMFVVFVVTGCVGLFVGLIAHEQSETLRRQLEANVNDLQYSVFGLKEEIMQRDERLERLRQSRDGMDEQYRHILQEYKSKTASLTAENDRLHEIVNKMSCYGYSKALENSQKMQFALNERIDEKETEIKRLTQLLETTRNQHWTALIEQHAKSAAAAAEKDRQSKIMSELETEKIDRVESPFRTVTLTKCNFNVSNVFVNHVTTGEGLRHGDQIFAVNDVPVEKLLSGKEVVNMITKAESPLRLVVRQNPNGLKMLDQLLAQLAKQRTDWAQAKKAI